MQGSGCTSFGLTDIVILPVIILYYYAPVQRISDTAALMNAWRGDGDIWRKRMLSQYWKPIVYLGAAVVSTIFIHFGLKINIHPLQPYIFYAAFVVWFIMLFIWPFVFCIRANRAYYRLEEWHQMQIEHRIAAGMASPADYYGYIQAVKEREYNRGYSAGKMMSRMK